MICECYRAEKNFVGKIGLCWGTAERDACSCCGDKSKCDFYPSVREEGKKPVTNYDRIIRKSPEELAVLFEDMGDCPPRACPHDGEGANVTRKDCLACWIDWLKQEVSTNG